MYANTNKIYPFIKNSFLKRLLIILLVIIIAFTSSFKPKEVKAVVPIVAGIAAVAGIVLTVTGIAVNATVLADWFSNKKGMNEDDVIDYFNNNISVDGDGNYIFTDDATMVINEFMTDYNDSVTMTYKYYVSPDNVDYSIFDNKSAMEEFVRVVKKYPDLRFKYIIKCSERWGSNAIWFYVFNDNDFECAVSSNFNLNVSQCDLYSPEWTSPLNYMLIGINDVPSDTGVTWCYGPKGNAAGTVTGKTFEDIYENDLAGPISSHSLSTATLSSSKTFSCRLDSYCIISSGNSAINCYKSVTDMKKDASNQVVGSYIDTYSGTPNFNITQTDIDNCVNNYYPSDPDDDSGGGSSGSDDSGGSSGGSGIIDGLGKLFGALGNIIDKLSGFVLGLLSKVVDFFGSILEMFTDSLTKLIDIIPTGFNEFLAAMFPYIPEEWITIAEFILLVSAIGCFVALFKR